MHAPTDSLRAATGRAHPGAPGSRRARPAPRRHEAGISIVLAMLVLFVLVIVLFQVRFTASVEMDHASAFVDSSRMGMLADAAFQQAQTQLLLDVDDGEDAADGGMGDPTGGAAGGDPFGGLGGGGPTGGGDDEVGEVGEAAEEANIADIMATTDSLLDEWQISSALAPALGQDFTMYVEVEDEDSKVNLLGMWNTDQEIADRQREIVRVLLDKAFEGTSRDFSYVDCTDLLDQLDDWVAGNRGSFDPVPVPKLKKSNQEEEDAESELETAVLDTEPKHFPMTLGELAIIEGFTAERLSGFIENDVFHPGLERYLTVMSHLELKPEPELGDDLFGASPFTQGSLFDKPAAGSPPPAAGAPGSASVGDEEEEEEEVFDPTNDGLVNANTAPLVVLRALAPEDIPTSFIEKIVEFRREIVRLRDEGVLNETGGSLFGSDSAFGGSSASDIDASGAGFGEDDEDVEVTDFVFTAPDEVVDKVESKYRFELNLDVGVKSDFTSLLTTTSNVFTIKILIMDKKSGRRASYRGTVWRATGGEFPRMITLMPLEPFHDPRRLKDFPEDLSDSSEDRFTYAAEKLQRDRQLR